MKFHLVLEQVHFGDNRSRIAKIFADSLCDDDAEHVVTLSNRLCQPGRFFVSVVTVVSMLKIMANENMEEWGASAIIEQETVRAIVQAYAEGKIELVKPSNKANKDVRYAPSFLVVSHQTTKKDKPYTAETVARFLKNVRDRKAKETTTTTAAP
jgi:hypothetical protein